MNEEILEVMSVFNLGVAVGTLVTVGFTDDEILDIVKDNIAKAQQAVGCVTSHTPE